MSIELDRKDADIEQIATNAADDEVLLRNLLAIDSTEQRHKDLIKGAILEAFDAYFGESTEKDRMLDFARAAMEGESPKTRKLAKAFLEKWND